MSPVHNSVTVPFREVDRELREQLRVMQEPDSGPTQRVRMSNLVVYCNSVEGKEAVEKDLADVVAIHPARVLLLVGEASAPGDEITASVQVSCSLMSRFQACTELVVMHAVGPAVDRLPFAVRSLLIGDLPTNLWWSCPVAPPMAGVLVFELAEHAQQIIYDSLGWMDPARDMAATAAWLDSVERVTTTGRWRVASDLNWRRLKYWRRLVGQALNPASSPGAAESVTELYIEHGPHAVIQAWELASWMAVLQGWTLQAGKVQPGVEMIWQFQAGDRRVLVRVKRLEDGPPEVRLVRLSCTLDGKPVKLALAIENQSRMSIALEGMADTAPRTIMAPPFTAADLIGKQLSDRDRDPVFRQSMNLAHAMAQGLLGY